MCFTPEHGRSEQRPYVGVGLAPSAPDFDRDT